MGQPPSTVRLDARALHAVAAGLVALVLVSGCARWQPRLRPAPAATADELLELLALRRGAVTSLRARARLKAGLRGAWTRQALLVQRPDSVRIDVLSPFGLALAVGVRDALLWAFPPSEATRYEGAATPENLRRVLGAPVSVPDVIDVLLGLPPARTPIGPATVTSAPAGGIALRLPLADGEQTIWFAGESLTVVRAEERRGEAPALRVVFGEHEDGFPRALDLDAADGTEARLRYETVEPNAALDPSLFVPPPAVHVRPFAAADLERAR